MYSIVCQHTKMAILFIALLAPGFSVHAQSQDFLQRLVGDWTIEGQQYAGSRVAASFTGTTTWLSVYRGRYVHEEYQFDVSGQKLAGESFLGWSDAANRWEYVQLDGFNPGMIWMTGEASDEDNLIMETVGGRSMSIRYEWKFEDQDILVVRLLVRRGDSGDWRLNSDYTYTRVD